VSCFSAKSSKRWIGWLHTCMYVRKLEHACGLLPDDFMLMPMLNDVSGECDGGATT
jgi:hypothetical protein